MIWKCLTHLLLENGSIVSFFKISYMSFVPFLVEQTSFIWKRMKCLGFDMSLSNFSAAMVTFKTFCKLSYVWKLVFRLNFLIKSFTVKKYLSSSNRSYTLIIPTREKKVDFLSVFAVLLCHNGWEINSCHDSIVIFSCIYSNASSVSFQRLFIIIFLITSIWFEPVLSKLSILIVSWTCYFYLESWLFRSFLILDDINPLI